MLTQSMNDAMGSVGSPAPILNIATYILNKASDVFSIDIEVIVMKSLYFDICIVWTEQLKDFCEFVGI